MDIIDQLRYTYIMDKTCDICNSIFKTYDKRQIFCSKNCYHKSRQKCVEIICKGCGKSFTTNRPNAKQIFCNIQCFHKFNTKPSIEKQCQNCGSFFKVQPYIAESRKNCSSKCKYQFLAKENSIRFEGVIRKTIEEKSQKFVYREKAFINFGKICKICKTENNRMDVHHIDGNRDNNKLENLVVLCHGCHQHIHNISKIHKKSLPYCFNMLQVIGPLISENRRSVAYQQVVIDFLSQNQFSQIEPQL